MNLNFSEKCCEIEISLFDEYSSMIYLQGGENHIMISKNLESTKGCGLIPLGTPCKHIETDGLKYDLGMISWN